MLFVYLANAQKEKSVIVEPEEFKTIKMAKFPIADFPKKSIPVSDIQVIQKVRDSFRVGYAFKGIDNYVVTLKTTKPLTAFLQEHIIRMYKNDCEKDGVKILWVVKDLRLAEKTAFMEYAYTRFNTDAYISKNGNLFKKVCTIDTVFVTESGGDVTSMHGNNIENAFKVLLKRTLKTGKDILELNTDEMTVAQITDQAQQQIDIPILTDLNYSEGAYANFEEFLQNKPSIIDFESVVIEKKKIKFVKPDKNNLKDTLEIWGLCKAGEIYKYHEETLIPIEKQGAGFSISNYIENTNRHNRNLFFFGLVGGITGGLVGGTAVALAANAAKGKQLLVKSIPYITKPNKQPVASCIDMKTGELSF